MEDFVHQWHVHPMLVHFPIALFLVALLFEGLSLVFKKEQCHQTAIYLYVTAALISGITVWTGLEEAEYLHLNHPVLTIHKNFALLTMYGSLISLPLFFLIKKTKAFRAIFIILLLLVAGFVSIAAYNGGRMVYEYGIGMDEK